MLGVFVDAVPYLRRHLAEASAHVELGAISVTGAGQDNAPPLFFLVAAEYRRRRTPIPRASFYNRFSEGPWPVALSYYNSLPADEKRLLPIEMRP